MAYTDLQLSGYQGSLVTARVDLIGGGNHQVVKLGFGPEGTFTAIDAANPMPVAVQAGGATAYTETTATIAVAGQAQTVFAANPNRKALLFLNKSDVSMTVTIAGAVPSASQGIILAAGEGLQLTGFAAPAAAVQVWCAEGGKSYYAAQG
jgi:hypothetical protein